MQLLAFVAQGNERAEAGGYCAAVAAACVAATADALIRATKDAEEADPAALSGHVSLLDPDAPHTLAMRNLQRGVTAVTNELSPPTMARPAGAHDAANQIPSSRFSGAKLDAWTLLERVASYQPAGDPQRDLVQSLALYLARAFEAARAFGVRDGGGWEGVAGWAERTGGAAVLLATYARTPY